MLSLALRRPRWRRLAGPVVLLGLVSAVSSRAQQIDDDAPLMEVAAFIEAQPAFARNCFRCHTSTSDETNKKGMEMLDMDRYPFGGKRAAIAGKAIRKSLGAGGGKATMPKDNPDTVSAEDLTKIFTWADAFDAARSKKDKDKDRDKDKPDQAQP